MSINSIPSPPPEVIVDFGWYSGTPPFRPEEYTYTSNGNNYPPAYTTLSSACSSPMTNGTIDVASTDTFDLNTIASVIVHDGTNWSLFTYETATGGVFGGCNSSAPAHTFAIGSAVWDPRFYVDQAPLRVAVTFDALDTLNLSLNKTYVPSDVEVIEWLWDFGNGETGSGSTATTTYPFNQAPPSVHVSLSTLDSLGRQASTAYVLYLSGSITPPSPVIPESNIGGGILWGGSVVVVESVNVTDLPVGTILWGGSVVESVNVTDLPVGTLYIAGGH